MIYRDVGKKMVDGFNKGMRDNVSSVGKKFAKASVQIKDAPTEDVAPVVHAYNKSKDGFLCSACTFGDFGLFRDYTPNYCPNCGARMDGGKE